MKRIVLYQEESYIIIQHISDTDFKYPPITIRKKTYMTQYEADLMRYSIKNNACESDFKTLYSFAVSSSMLNRIKKHPLSR